MNKTQRIDWIGRHMMDMVGLFHGLLRLSTIGDKEGHTSFLRFYVLKYMRDCGQRSLTDISDHLHFRKNTLSELLDRMVNDGLVQRDNDPADRRKLCLAITPAGRAAVEDFKRNFVQKLSGALERFTDREADDILAALETMLEASEKMRRIIHPERSPASEETRHP